MAEFIAVSSESDSGEEMDTLMLLYLTSQRQNSVWKSEYSDTSANEDNSFRNHIL